jgi:hypothetical protein
MKHLKILTNLHNALNRFLRKHIVSTSYKLGWIEEVDNNLIICRLRKDYELDDCLTFERSLLTEKQNKLVAEGQIIKYDKKKSTILFALSDGNWC